MITWMIFEILGTIAFAASGAMVGLVRRMDIFGIVVLSSVTAVGGGILRDLLVGITPPTALCNSTNTLLAIGTAIFVSLLYEILPLSRQGKKRLGILFSISDTIGLAAFTVTGTLTGLRVAAGEDYLLPVTLGILTAVGGGIMRDIMALRVPTVLRIDVYAAAAIAGAFTVCAMTFWGQVMAAPWWGFLLVVLLRGCAIRFGWQLYHPRPRGRFLLRWLRGQKRPGDS